MAPVVVFETWHARGELTSDDVRGLLSVLPLSGFATLETSNKVCNSRVQWQSRSQDPLFDLRSRPLRVFNGKVCMRLGRGPSSSVGGGGTTVGARSPAASHTSIGECFPCGAPYGAEFG